MKRAISLLLMICLILTATPFGFDVFGVDYEIPGQFVGDDQPTASEIEAQIKDIYQKSKASRGSSFSGFCGAYVGWQLYHMGINTSCVAPNGNEAWDTYKNMTTTSGGFTVDKYAATNSTLKQTLKALCENGTKNVYNIMVCMQKGNTAASATYGHVSFIHAIIDGVVYFSESGKMGPLSGKYYYEGDVIAFPIDYVCEYIYTWDGLGYVPQVEGVIHFTKEKQLSADEIRDQIKDISDKSKNSFGASFSGYCGAYVGWQLYHMGINTSCVAPNGNEAWDTYKNMTTTSGGYTVNKYSATNSTLKQVFKDLTANGTKNVYNVMLCLQKGNTQSAQTYGHVVFIHAIIDGVVYFSENNDLTLSSGKYAQGNVIDLTIDSVCNLYTSTYIEGCTPQIEGIIHFTRTGNQNGISVSWSEDTQFTQIGNTDATVSLKYNISGWDKSGFSGDGIYLYDFDGHELASFFKEETTNLTAQPVYFKISERLKYTLSPGTTYKYKIYIKINGKPYESGIYSFTTTGTHSHKNNAEWDFDETYHWKNCITCGAENSKASHNYMSGVCNVCGQVEEIPTEEEFYTYTVTDGKATITDVSDSFGGDIIIPSTLGGYPVVAIAESVFANRNDISSITIPEGVTDIGDYAFYGCTHLQSVTIPDSVTYIGWSAFGDCEDLERVTFGYGIESLDYATFENCRSLHKISLPDSLTFLGDDVFNGCYNLTEVYMPENLTIIGDGAFSGCFSLNEITIPETVTYIGAWAFSGSGLEIADFENELGWCIEDLSLVFSYGDLYYEGVENKAAEYLSDDYVGYDWTRSDENIDDISYYMYEIIDGGAAITGAHPSISGDVTIPSTLGGYPVISIEYCAFWWCEKLESIIIPDSVVYISSCAFNNCQALKSIVLPKKLEYIGLEAFSDCISLKSITIPANVVNIELWAFSGCNNLEDVYFENTEGWIVNLYGSDDIVEISSNDLANSKKAAEYLTDTHSNDSWTCTAVDCKHRAISDFWYSGLGFHWKFCYSCGEDVEIERHVAVDGVCTICDNEVEAIANVDSANATYGDTVIIEVELMDALKTDTLGFELELPQGITLVESENTCWMIDGELTAISTSPIRGVWANLEEIDPNGTILSFEFKIEDDAFLGQNEIILEIYPDDTEEGRTSDAVIELGGIIYVNEYTLGDIDGVEGVDAKDAIYLLYNVFFGDTDYPVNQDCDFNGDNSVTSEDAIYLLYHVFFGDEAYPLF